MSSTPNSFLHCSAAFSISFALTTSNFRARRNLRGASCQHIAAVAQAGAGAARELVPRVETGWQRT